MIIGIAAWIAWGWYAGFGVIVVSYGAIFAIFAAVSNEPK